MTKDEALKMALDAFGEIDWCNNSQWQSDRAKVAIASLKEALAQQEQDGECKYCTDGCPACDARKLPEQDCIEPDYKELWQQMCERCDSLDKKLAQRTWVGLTEAECGVLWKVDMTPFDYYQAIEAKLKERNG
jgi:hypothetical protein